MPTNLENSEVATGLEKVSFHSNPKERKKESEVAQSCSALCDPMDCNLPGFPIHGIFQARVLEWVAIFFSRESSWPRDRTQVSFTVWIPKKGNAKEGSNDLTIALISHASKVMPKILQARLQQYVNREIPDVQAGFRKGRGTRDQIAIIRWTIEKAREFKKNIYFCFID